MKNELLYIGFYSTNHSNKPRFSNIAAIKKMDYVADALQRAGFFVHIISPSWLIKSISFQKSQRLILKENILLTTAPSFSFFGKLSYKLSMLFSLSWLFCWLILNTKRRQKILLYHSPILSIPIRLAKLIVGFNLTIEIGEIYGDVWEISNIQKKWEMQLLNCADNFIPCSETLAEILGPRSKIILYGDYKFKTIKNSIHNSSIVNVVYAGSVDQKKNGAFISINCAKYLPSNYIVHIAGYGNENDISKLCLEIRNMNKMLKREACIFHGLLDEKELFNLFSNCSIAVNPQVAGEYMKTAFPSKVLVYLTYGLSVISTKVKSIESSRLSVLIRFIESDDPEILAHEITKPITNKACLANEILDDLDQQFLDQAKLLFTFPGA
jgi:glycosyltransferase involved in cell wall biosynthesis